MIEIALFEPSDYDEVMALWGETGGLTLRDADSREAIARFLARNPGLSLVAREKDQLVGALLAGTDGRRGYLHHLAVTPTHRGRGLGRALVERAVMALSALGIAKCHIMVRRDNSPARGFWERLGWSERKDILLMSCADSDATNA